MFSLYAIVFRFVFAIDIANEKRQNITLRPNAGFNKSTSTPSIDGHCIRCYAAQHFHPRGK
jgi:hypothetical protein